MKRPAVFLLAAGLLFAQAEKKKLTFDVVSIKLHKPGDVGGFVSTPPGGRYTASNAGLDRLIQAAYVDYGIPVPGTMIEGFPGWAEKDRFDGGATGTGFHAHKATDHGNASGNARRTVQAEDPARTEECAHLCPCR
jgi:hypothetical protein